MHEAEVIARDEGIFAKEAQSDGTPIEERVVRQVLDLEAWYAAQFQRRLTELTELLSNHLQVQVEELQQHYDRRVQSVQEKAQANAAVVVAQNPERLLEEIKRTEALAYKCASELERMLGDDSVNLGLMLQMRNQQLEVRAYLRGLKFSAESAQASPTTQPDHEII
jgi:hypothetical protein